MPEVKAAEPIAKGAETLVEENNAEQMSFPHIESKIVYVRRVKRQELPIIGENLTDESIVKIGSSFKNKAPLKGLLADEEKRFLPYILGINNDSPNWEKEIRNYWSNISRIVPPGNEGLKLEVGLVYDNIEDYNADKKAPRNKDGIVVNPKGRPIELDDYILWRYCLEYSRVANDVKDIGKSPKIELYLYSKEAELKEKKVSFDQRKKATQLMYQRIGERSWVEYMLRLLITHDKESGVYVKDLVSMTSDEKDILLEKYATNNPIIFTTFGNDKDLELKALLELAVAMNVITRIPNTSALTYQNDPIGNTSEEAVAYLKNPKNAQLLNEITAQTKVKPS